MKVYKLADVSHMYKDERDAFMFPCPKVVAHIESKVRLPSLGQLHPCHTRCVLNAYVPCIFRQRWSMWTWWMTHQPPLQRLSARSVAHLHGMLEVNALLMLGLITAH